MRADFWNTRDPLVYFVQSGDPEQGRVKIGTTHNLRSRLRALDTGSPHPLRLLGVTPGDEAEEDRLHNFFAQERVHGEWFLPSRRLLDWIALHASRISREQIEGQEPDAPGETPTTLLGSLPEGKWINLPTGHSLVRHAPDEFCPEPYVTVRFARGNAAIEMRFRPPFGPRTMELLRQASEQVARAEAQSILYRQVWGTEGK